MRIQLDEATLVDELMRALEKRGDAVVERVGETELEAGLIGSFHDGGQAELERFLRAWLARRGHGGSPVRLLP
jgi:hypothetical protein